jgi:hypothetical protein
MIVSLGIASGATLASEGIPRSTGGADIVFGVFMMALGLFYLVLMRSSIGDAIIAFLVRRRSPTMKRFLRFQLRTVGLAFLVIGFAVVIVGLIQVSL